MPKVITKSDRLYLWIPPAATGNNPWASRFRTCTRVTLEGGRRGWGSRWGPPSLRHPLIHFSPQESLFLLLQYLPPGVIALVNFLGPLLFVFLVQLENYPPNTEVNLTLIW